LTTSKASSGDSPVCSRPRMIGPDIPRCNGGASQRHVADDMNERASQGERAGDDQLLLGSPEDFGRFFDRHGRAVLSYLYRRTADPEMAADLVAETFAQAYRSRWTYRDTGPGARAWLFGIAANELKRALRRKRVDDRARRRLGIERVAMDELSFERIEELADFAPIRDAVRRAMSSLSPKLSDAVALRVGLDLPYEEVARRLSCSEGTARVRVARGLARLNQILEAS
jgi:RNA polymerase sigma factor (sigma-70 family)